MLIQFGRDPVVFGQDETVTSVALDSLQFVAEAKRMAIPLSPMAEIVTLPKITDPRGNLTFIQKGQGIPFEPKRVFWTFNVPSGSVRGGHAYKSQWELIVAINGAFDVVVKEPDGREIRHRLDRGNKGLLLPPMTWRWMEEFSTNGMGLHVSDLKFDSSDYIREFEEFKRLT